MATIVDRMVTEYVLDSRPYAAGTRAVVRDSAVAGQAIEHTERRARGLGIGLGAFMSGIAGAIRMASVALTVAGGAVVGLGVYAMKTAAEFDTLERTLVAVTGSLGRAKEILAFVDELAVPSVFGTKELAEAARTLEAFGLQTERFLPVVEKLGTVFGGSAEKLDQFVRALGYIRGGRFGEGFEALAAAGITREELMGRGLQFDRGGGFVGDARQALETIERLVSEKYGRLADEMASGPAARMASLWDNVQRGIRRAGAALLEAFLPYLDMGTNLVADLLKDGAFERIGQSVASWFAPDGPIVRGVLLIAAYLSELPDLWERIRYGALATYNVIAGIVNRLIEMRNQIVEVFSALARLLQKFGMGAVGLTTMLPRVPSVPLVDNPAPTGTFDPDAKARGWQSALEAAYADAVSGGQRKQEVGGAAAQVPAALQEVASNTAELVAIGKRQLELQEGSLGGGRVGQIGLTPAESLGIRRRSAPIVVAG